MLSALYSHGSDALFRYWKVLLQAPAAAREFPVTGSLGRHRHQTAQTAREVSHEPRCEREGWPRRISPGATKGPFVAQDASPYPGPYPAETQRTWAQRHPPVGGVCKRLIFRM